ncbi:MAG: methyl-accepting chemotaxis protein [Clostridium sp.]
MIQKIRNIKLFDKNEKTTKSKLLKIVFSLVGLLAIIFITITTTSLSMFSNRTLNMDLGNGNRAVKLQTQDYFWGLSGRGTVILNSKVIQKDYKNNETENLKDIVNGFNTNTNLITRSYVTLENGYKYSYPMNDGYNNESEEVKAIYNSAKEKGTVWYGPYKDEVSGESIITLNQAVLDDNGDFIGVLGLDVKFIDLDVFTNETVFSETGHSILLDRNGYVVSGIVDESFIGEKLKDEYLLKSIEEGKNETGITELYGSEYLYKYSKVEDCEITIITLVSKTEHRGFIIELIVMIGIILAILCPLTIYIITKFSNKLGDNIKSINQGLAIAESGNINTKLSIQSNDEFESIANSFNSMIDSFRGIITSGKEVSDSVNANANELNELSTQVAEHSEEIAQAIEQIANASSSQAIEVDSVVTKIDELASEIDRISEKINNTYSLCNTAMKNNERGSTSIDNLIISSDKTRQSVDNINGSINKVEESSKSINSILNIINSITSQTNLLALNASIEAARAGEAGKGFDVVAREIKSLAEESSNATNDIKTIIETIIVNIGDSTKAVNDIIKAVDDQTISVVDTQESFNLIEQSIKEINSEIGDIDSINKGIIENKELISNSVENLAAAIEETTSSTEEISALTEGQLSSLQEVKKSSDYLVEESSNLNKSLSRFTII